MQKRFSDRSFVLHGAMMIWGAISLVNFTVWAMICVIGQHLSSPWWLWVAVPPAFVLVPLWLSERRASPFARGVSGRLAGRRAVEREEL